MTKKEKILKMFDEADWIKSPSGKDVKLITSEMFIKVGLGSTTEYGEKYSDPIYAAHVYRKMGYRVLLGITALHVHKKNNKTIQSCQ